MKINWLQEKKMKQEKESSFAIGDDGKESIASRLRMLIGQRTVRSAAADWGLAFSTLNNYLTRGTEPSLNVAVKISHVEGVPVEWLATGICFDEAHTGKLDSAEALKLKDNGSTYVAFTGSPAPSSKQNDEHLYVAWSMIYEALSPQQRANLINLFMKIGANGVIEKLSEENERDSAWETLSTEDKERLIRLNEQLKKGTFTTGEDTSKPGLAENDKKAG